jgi:ABC-type multidrug transport system fused ATPase/permease subunit
MQVSLDLNILDLDIPFAFMFSLAASLNAYSNLGVLAVVKWEVLLVSVPMVVLATRLQVIGVTSFLYGSSPFLGLYDFIFQFMQRYYLATAKELMRISGTTKSTLANHLSESISGAITVRAFGEEDRFFTENLDLVDKNASPCFHNFAATEWLIQRLELMSAVVLSFSAFLMVLLPQGTFTPGKLIL